MAHAPKLEIYKIYLKSTTETPNNTFEDYLKSKFKIKTEDYKFKDSHKLFLESIVSSIDKDFVLSKKLKKGLGLEQTQSGVTNTAIKINTSKYFIHGTIQGGRYGQNRSLGNITKPTTRSKINDKNIVLDNFYFLLYTPEGSSKGLLFLQSYTDDSINEVFINWIKNLLKTDGFYRPTVEHYSPAKIQEEFKRYSIVKELKYSKDIVINDIGVVNSIDTNGFTVEIVIRAKDQGVSLSKLEKFANFFGASTFKASNEKGLKLEEFNKKVGQLNNGSHQSSFVLNDKIEITPTIFLKEKIKLNADQSPDWVDLHRYCQELLLEVIEEVYPEQNELS
ncbi:hypothetical protein SAMN04487898_11350 [Pedobacter sp. ok626]|uniref:hypothetical protein n=1 Tax=Pedobacter sp. ok626 TaxID=1761882 RepID=UPI00087E8054|nr:hypothetical protein [Pedobacter sp. ok626]SDK92989.1 hypothetical protein SAMN04487898_11350 [Pedobacter sp. ok626]